MHADSIQFNSLQVLSTDRVEFRVVMGKDSKVDADSGQQVENGAGPVQGDDARSSRGEMTPPLSFSPPASL